MNGNLIVRQYHARVDLCMYMRPGQTYLPLHMSKVKALAVIFVIQFEPLARFSLHFVVFTFSSVSCLFSATQSS